MNIYINESRYSESEFKRVSIQEYSEANIVLHGLCVSREEEDNNQDNKDSDSRLTWEQGFEPSEPGSLEPHTATAPVASSANTMSR